MDEIEKRSAALADVALAVWEASRRVRARAPAGAIADDLDAHVETLRVLSVEVRGADAR